MIAVGVTEKHVEIAHKTGQGAGSLVMPYLVDVNHGESNRSPGDWGGGVRRKKPR